MQLALADPASTEGVRAGELLLKRGHAKLVAAKIEGDDPDVAINAVSLLGFIGNKDTVEILKPLPIDDQRTRPLRTAALDRATLSVRWLMARSLPSPGRSGCRAWTAKGRRASPLSVSRCWLGDRDSNPDSTVQSRMSYH